jgi:GST-like protein
MELIGSLGCGSMIVEMALALTDLPCTLTDVPYLEEGPERARLVGLNPLGQVPTLLLDDGVVMTESAAIMLYLDGRVPRVGLIPAPEEAGRAAFLNRLVLLVAAIYPTFTYGDRPERWTLAGEAADALRARTDAAREKLLLEWEAVAGPGPYAAGARISALDLYLLPMTYWRPRRAWFEAHAPQLKAFADETARHPVIAPVFERHRPIWEKHGELF